MSLETFFLAALIAETQPARVAILPYEPAAVKHCRAVAGRVEKKFRFKVAVLPSRKLPAAAYYPPRGRYRAEKLLADLNQVPGFDHVIGITVRDISTQKGKIADWGIFGLGHMPGKSCVISTFRLSRKVERVSPQQRLARVVFHEIGHTLGLPHCPAKSCLVADAEGAIASVDRGKDFCASCRTKVKTP